MKLAAVALALIVAYAFGANGKDKEAKTKIAELESRLAETQAKVEKQDSQRGLHKVELEMCLNSAEEAYWQYVKLNGRQKKGTEIWTARMDVWNQAAQEKRNVIEACRVRFAQN